MTTTEPELTEPVDLCAPGGRILNPAARGWSRRPLHRCDIAGTPGRKKRWDYWAVLGRDVTVALTYADVDYLGIASVWWCDLETGRSGGRDIPMPGALGFSLPDQPGTEPLRFRSRWLDLAMVDDDGGTTLTARWLEPGGARGRLSIRVDLPEGHESLNVVIPWSDRLFQFTSKHQARPAHGELQVGDRTWLFGAGNDPSAGEPAGADSPAWGVLDVGRGRWPYETRWNWGGGAGRSVDGSSVVGLQFGGKWTEGTGFTENGVIVDGRLHKIGAELRWDYRWDDPLAPWRVSLPDGTLDVTLTPVHDRHTKAQGGILATEVHQVFGTWSGHVTDEAGRLVEIQAISGFAEESRSRW